MSFVLHISYPRINFHGILQTTDPPVFFTPADDEAILTFERYLKGPYYQHTNESVHFFPEGPRKTEISRIKRMASVLKLRRS
jgi:hypothetical protein